MKKFFRALAVVLTLALVIGTVPASAATAPTLKFTSKTLYVGDARGYKEVDGTKTYSKYLTRVTYAKALEGVNNKADAKKQNITATTSNANIVKVNNDTFAVKAVGIGKATVTYYADGKKIGTVTYTVKKTAGKVVFGTGDTRISADKDDVAIGAAYTVSLPRNEKDANGNTVPLDTDQRRLIIKDEAGTVIYNVSASVATADQKNDTTAITVVEGKDDKGKPNRLWTITFLKAGKYTIIGEAYQSDKSYPGTNKSAEITVKVTEGTMDKASQSTYKSFDLTFSTADLAAAARTNTIPSLNTGKADVTEADKIIKVFKINKFGEEIAAFIEGISIKASDKKVLSVSMFADLEENTTYKVQYGADTLTFKAVDYLPETVAGYEKSYTPFDDGTNRGGTAQLDLIIYSVNEDGQNVDITGKVKSSGTAVYYDINQAKHDSSKYNLTGDTVDFYVDDYSMTAKVLFTYYYNNKPVELENEFAVSSSDKRTFTVLNYSINDDGNPDPGNKREAYISADDKNMVLDVRIKSEIVVNGETKVLDDKILGTNINVKFVTSNTDKLAIEEDTGKAYSPKAASGKVAVWVYFNGRQVDADASEEGIQPIYVTVYDHKRLGSIDLSDISDGKIGYNDDPNISYTKYVANGYNEDDEHWKLTVKDEQGRAYEDVTVYVKKVTDIADGHISVQYGTYTSTASYKDGVYSNPMSSFESWNTFGEKYIVFKTDTPDVGAQTVTYDVTVVDNNSDKYFVRRLSFKVKNTKESTVSSYRVEPVSNSYMTYRIVGYDVSGYPACVYKLANTALRVNTLDRYKTKGDGSYLYLGFFRNSDGAEMVFNGNTTTTATMKITENVTGGKLTKLNNTTKLIGFATNMDTATSSAIVVSGGALSSYELLSSAIQHEAGTTTCAYIASGTYSARAYCLSGGRTVSVNTNVFDFSPSSFFNFSWNWGEAYSDYTNIGNVLNRDDDEHDPAVTFKIVLPNGSWTNWSGDKEFKSTLYDIVSAGFPITLSVQEKDDSITVLYAYVHLKDLYSKYGRFDADNNWISVVDKNQYADFVEIPILRTIYTGVERR